MDNDILFPHDAMRPVQEELVTLVDHCVRNKQHLVVHAPTGLGKTAATLAPALTYVLDKDMCVVFVTPRHTQHLIALRTARDIKDKHHVRFCAMSIVGKRGMCAHQNTADMRSDDFAAYCKGMREGGQCIQYINARHGQGVSTQAKAVVKEMEQFSPLPSEEFVKVGIEKTLCPYELALHAAERAKLIVTDYHYLFTQSIRDKFLGRINRRPEQLIVIVDEGHNLPARVRESLTHRITSAMVRRAIKEAEDFHCDDALPLLIEMSAALEKLSGRLTGEEMRVTYEDWETRLAAIGDITTREELLDAASDAVQESNKKHSSIMTVARFMNAWHGSTSDAFARIFSRGTMGAGFVLSLRCLDPAIATRDFIAQTHATIIMSGTLRPMSMFAQQLGFPASTIEKEYGSPFPHSNKLCIVHPGVTTKFAKRSDLQYANIAKACADVVNAVPGCSAIFFPSYAMLEAVQERLDPLCRKTVFREVPTMTKEQRTAFLERFKGYAASGAVLLGVAAGSFGEGIDLPGVLKAVIVVGIPLERTNLETQQLIEYYDKLCGKGWEYGYTLPALMRTMQNAGRLIRSETDRGVLVFMDERYIWPSYKRCFPDDWALRVSADPVPLVQKFFS